MSKVQFYDAIEANFGYKFSNDGARRAFYDQVNFQTGAGNGEICRAVNYASAQGMKPRGDYGRVMTSDVVHWVLSMRRSSKAKKATPSGNRYRSCWISNMRSHIANGHVTEADARADAEFVCDDGETVDELMNEVLR